MLDLYDPLTFDNLMSGLVRHFEAIDKSQLRELDGGNVEGPGIYALFYTVDLDFYEPIAADGQHPIYVGKAVPPGSRKGGKPDVSKPMIFGRLKNHSRSIEAARNLDLAHFQYRSLAVVPVCITLAERFLVENYKPVWNICLEGFGKNVPGRARARQRAELVGYTAPWSRLGRKRARRNENPRCCGGDGT